MKSLSRRAFFGSAAVLAVARPAAGQSGSALIQSAIEQARAAGGGVIRCAPGATYVCSQSLVFDDLAHVTIDGAQSQWIYSGAGSEFVSAKGAMQVTWRDLRIQAAPGFTGSLVSTDWSGTRRDPSHLAWRDCEFDGGGAARAGLRLNRAIFADIQHCQFTGASWGILGQDGAYSNVVTISGGCAFYSLTRGGIYNAGESWRIVGNGFEPLVNGAACAYTQDLAGVHVRALTFADNWCGDISTPGGCWLTARGSAITVMGNYFGSPGAVTDPCLRLTASQGVLIAANHNQTTGRFLELTPAAGYSYNVTVQANDLGIGAVVGREWCAGLRLINNFGQVDV